MMATLARLCRPKVLIAVRNESRNFTSERSYVADDRPDRARSRRPTAPRRCRLSETGWVRRPDAIDPAAALGLRSGVSRLDSGVRLISDAVGLRARLAPAVKNRPEPARRSAPRGCRYAHWARNCRAMASCARGNL